MSHRSRKLSTGHYTYRGYETQRMEDGHWNIKEAGTDFWTDGSATLADAKSMIDRWLEDPR